MIKYILILSLCSIGIAYGDPSPAVGGSVGIPNCADTVAGCLNDAALGDVTATINSHERYIAKEMALLVAGGGGGGGGGAVTIADGGAVAIGSLSDTAWVSGNGSLISITKANNAKLATLVSLLPTAIGQQTMAASLGVVIASDQSAIPVTGTFYQATQPVSVSTLPLPTGAATAANQAGFGTAGAANANVTTIQGIASMTPILDTPQATENHIGEFGGWATSLSITPTITSGSAYASGNNVGTAAPYSLTNAFRKISGTGNTAIVQSFKVIDSSLQKMPLDIIIFDGSTLTTTGFTDRTAMPTFSTNDIGHILRRISVAASDYVTVGGVAIADISSIAKIIVGDGSHSNIQIVINAEGAATFTSTTALTFSLGIMGN